MQQIKRTRAVRCPVGRRGRVIDAECGLQIGISFEKTGYS